MIFEDSRLHEVPKPWYSFTRRIGSLLMVIGILFLVVFIGIFMDTYDSPEGFSWPVLLFLVFGLFLLLFGLYGFLDNKDKWMINLPFNRLLYELVSEKTPEMLQQNGYKFLENENSTIINAIKSNGRPVAKSYRIIAPGNYFDFEFALTYTSSKNGGYYNFAMTISNVTMKNLYSVKKFHGQMHAFLEKIEYRKFKEVLKD